MSQPEPTSLAQQSIIDVGSETRPPMLENGSYIQWSNIFMRYIEIKPNGKYLKHSIEQVLYQRRVITIRGNSDSDPPMEPTTRVQLDSGLETEERKQVEADTYIIIYILLGILNSIYSSVDLCKNAKDTWERNHERPERHDLLPKTIVANTKFLNCLQPAWKRNSSYVGNTLRNVGNAGNSIGNAVNGDEELTAACIMMAKIKEYDTNSDGKTNISYDIDGLSKQLKNSEFDQRVGYRNAMECRRCIWTHPERKVVAQLLTDEEIIESVIGINKDDIDEEDDESSTMEPPSRNEAIKAAITLNNFYVELG
ncbi:hypothetical protein Tco_1041615 [Tanacetum coccineum]|uniref:Uncharacterized protein n=1 Tax=Tanacetum coccineum TaxID=301880 RepID=A0ABQ5GHA7_9ASTR